MTRRGQKGGVGLQASALPATCTHVWDLQPDEPLLWYARFEIYRTLGPHRTVTEACNTDRQRRGLPRLSGGHQWYLEANKWKWQERAVAWDAAEREQARAEEKELRRELRERRLHRLEKALDVAYGMFDQANLTSLTEEQARTLLPTTRQFMRDLLTMEDRELSLSEKREQPQPPPPATQPATWCADDLRRIQLQLEAWRANQQAAPQAPAQVESHPQSTPAAAHPGKQTLLVCVGPDPSLTVDLAALRAVKAATGLDFHRIPNVTCDSLDAYLRRERSKGRPVELLHLSVHAGHDGVHFANGVVDGDWLSQRLLGVRVLLLAGCEGDRVGDWLGVVPHVVTLAEEITHEDAAALTQHFWTAIGRGREPGIALDEALAHCAPVVSEYVIRHW